MTMRVEAPGEKTLNLDPCKCYENEIKKTENKFTRRAKEVIKKSWDFRTKVTVEPFVVCYILPSVLAGLAVQNLSLEKSCLVNLGYDEVTCSHIMQGKTHNYSEQEKNVQRMVASMTAWSFPVQTAIPGFLTLFVGAWSDRTGNRKAFMVIPILGKLLSAIGLIFSTIFFLQVGLNETALIEGFLPALSGGRVVMTMAVYSYITDITSDTDRTFRLGIITAILTLIRPVGLALGGVMTTRVGYYGVFVFACMFYLIGFVYIVIRLKEKKTKTVDDGDKLKVCSVFCVKDLVATLNVGFKTRPGWRRLQIILIMFAYMFIVGPVIGEAQMTYWFTRYKFKFTEVDYSMFLTYSVLVGSVGSFITIYFFVKRWQLEDSVIGVIACISRIAASMAYALAPNRTVYFMGPVLDMFSSAGATSLRSIATKLVMKDEVGKTSSLISISEALVPVIYSPVYAKVYLSTLSNFPGAFYLISGGLALPAIFILILLFILRNSDEAETTTPAQETVKAKESEITNF